MFVIGALLALVLLLPLAWIAKTLHASRTPDDTDDRPRSSRRRIQLVVALLLQLAGIGVAVVVAVLDAKERTYQVAWLVLGPAAIALSALACAFTVLGSPRRADGFLEATMWLGFAVAIGITACYGALFGTALLG